MADDIDTPKPDAEPTGVEAPKALSSAPPAAAPDGTVKMSRRRFLGAALAVVAGAAVAVGQAPSQRVKITERDAPESLELDDEPESPLDYGVNMNRRIQAFATALNELTSQNVFFIDANGEIIDGPRQVSDEILALDKQIRECYAPPSQPVPKNRRERAAQAALRAKYTARRKALRTARKHVFQRWVNAERQKLAEKYKDNPAVRLVLSPSRKDAQEPELVSTRISLAGDPDLTAKLFDHIKKPLASPVSSKNPMPRYAFIKQAFVDTHLPQSFKDLMPGMVAIESQGRDHEVSSVGAEGPWQIMDGLGREIGLIGPGFDNRKDFEKATRAMVGYFEKRYQAIKRAAEKIRTIYFTGDQAAGFEDNFVVLCTINSHIAGFARVVGMIDWFAQLPIDRVKTPDGKQLRGQDIYSFMSLRFRDSGVDPGYFRASCNYYPEIAAAAELLEDEFAPGIEEEPVAAVELRPDTVREETRELPIGSIGAGIAAAGTAVLAAADLVQRNPKIPRRAIMHAGVIGAVTGLGLGLGRALRGVGGLFRARPAEEPRRGPWQAPRQPQASAKQPAPQISRIPGHAPREVPEMLLADFRRPDSKIRKFRVVPLSPQEQQALRARGINPKLRQWAQEHGLRTMAIMEDIDRLDRQRRLAHLQEVSSAYRCSTVGLPQGNADKYKNDMRYARLLPPAARMIERISQELNDEAHKLGLPNEWRVRINIAGAGRTEAYQFGPLAAQNGVASKKWSAHTTLSTFDIPWARFDIIHVSTGKFVMLMSSEAADAEMRLTSKLQTILGRILIRLMDEGQLLVRKEFDSATYHTMCTGALGLPRVQTTPPAARGRSWKGAAGIAKKR